MDFKLLILLLFTINCNAQKLGGRIVVGPGGPANIRLPVVTTQNNILEGEALGNTLRTIPSGNVRQFITYPTLRTADEGIVATGGLVANNIGVLPAPAPAIFAPPQPVLEKVATLGLVNGLTGGIPLGAQAQVLGPVIAAILTQRTAEVVDVPVPQDIVTPQVLIVEPNLLPVTIEFRSQSSPVNINQVHIPGPPGEIKETRSEEEPDRVLHEVVKPVIQEVREIIQPFRRITQQILPVQEEVHSVVARGERQQVLQEVPIPPPVPIAVSAPAPVAVAPAPVAVAAPRVAAAAAPLAGAAFATQPLVAAVRQPVTFERTVSVEPVVTAVNQQILTGPAPTGTVVRAGLIGGARIIQAPGIFDEGNGQGLGTRAIVTGLAAHQLDGGLRLGNPIKREAIEEKVIEETSINNRPNGPFKREVVFENNSA